MNEEESEQEQFARELSEKLSLTTLEGIRDQLEHQLVELNKAWSLLKKRTEENLKNVDEKLFMLAFSTTKERFRLEFNEPQAILDTKRCQEIIQGAIIRKAKELVGDKLQIDAFAVGDVHSKIVFNTESLTSANRPTIYAEDEEVKPEWKLTTFEDLKKLISVSSPEN